MLCKLQNSPRSNNNKIIVESEMVTYLGERNKWFRNLAQLSFHVQVLSPAPKAKWENYVILAAAAAAAANSLQSCPTLCDPIDGSPPGSPIPGILQAEQKKHKTHFQITGPNVVRSFW